MNELTLLLIEWGVKAFLVFFLLATGFAYVTLLERRVLSLLQVRIGPNRAGPFGILQPAADGLKLFLKEDLVPAGAYKIAFFLAPILTMVPAIVILGVVPFGESVELFGRQIFLGISDINVGVLYILSVASVSVYGIVLAGWSSNNKYAMLGGMRSTAQMISYELALGLSFIPPIMMAGSLSMLDIVHAQQTGLFGWYIWQLPLALTAFVFYIAMLAEVNRAPFDMPEAEQELTAGYHTEYSGMKFALFFMGEYIKMIAVSAIMATLFFGGFDGPFVTELPWLGPLYLVLKIVASLVVMIWIRASFPRLRYDRLMAFGWKFLLPLSLFNVVFTAVWIAVFQGF
jgi:NADH-quinone oxidoreductase subunit H